MPGLPILLFLLFLGLKLGGAIAWSWVWVTAPLWGSVVLAVAFFIVWLVGAGIAAIAIRKF